MNKLVVVAAVVVGIAGIATWRTHHHARALLEDRLWVDRVPSNDRDVINVFVTLGERSLGAFQAASAWRGTYEGFRYESSGDELRMLFPQTGDKERATARARKCDVRGMDYCLELSGTSRGVTRYFSRKGWEIDRLDQVRPLVESLAN